jgi:preprotein translocase subunit SecF
VPFEIIPPGTNFDFIGKRRLFAGLSLLMLVVGLAGVPVRGLRWGIDFAGGSEVQVRFLEPEGVGEGRIREVVQRTGVSEPSVVRFGDPKDGEFRIRFREDLAQPGQGERVDALEAALREAIGPLEVERVEFVGPRVGAELRRDGLLALGISCGLILVYIAFRFTLRFAPGAVVALIHDVLVTSGIWVTLGQEFNLQVLAALLTILGYSLNDTIVVYDRIRENMQLRTAVDLPEVLNRSVNQTLSRTILTGGSTLLALLALTALGGEVLRPFALVMTIGIVLGTYSSIYVAAPILLLLERRFGRAPAPAKRAKTARA